jgi:hypothetical protein
MATTDPLASLGEQGFDPSGDGGWTHPGHDITVHQTAPNRYQVRHAGRTVELTSGTGALCLVDTLIRKAATEPAGA